MPGCLISLLERVRALRNQDGYVMVTVMGVLLVATLFSVAALAAADRDVPQSRNDVDRKGALAAADAGLNYYLYHLNEDNNFWTQCEDVEDPGASTPAPVNQPWNGTGADPRIWRNVPDSSDAQYTIELIPAPGKPSCDKNDAAGSMINPANGTFRIRATGRSAANRTGRFNYRTVVATFRRRGFLDYLYFTDYETSPPSYYSAFGADRAAWASTACAKWWRAGRDANCTKIQFASNDIVNGPLHTNDDIYICGGPTFGRVTDAAGNAVKDRVEVSDPNAPGYRNSCAGAPNVRPAGNALKINQPVLTLPPSNTALINIVKPEYLFTGTTTIRLRGTTMDVTDYGGPGGAQRTQTNMTWPGNGVVYVRNGTCGTGSYNAVDPYNVATGCAVAYVSGEYGKSMTITSERDVVIRPLPSDADNTGVKRSSGTDAMLGLIGNDHVRVFHETANGPTATDLNCDEDFSTGSKRNITIEAAILALNYSFIVDHYFCGDPLGNLTVKGVIAQRFRGPVGTGGSSGNSTGYIKNYNYDDRLVYRSPPYFLDPVQSAWQIVRHNEQVPATKPPNGG